MNNACDTWGPAYGATDITKDTAFAAMFIKPSLFIPGVIKS